jgi:hypothetical protein
MQMNPESSIGSEYGRLGWNFCELSLSLQTNIIKRPGNNPLSLPTEFLTILFLSHSEFYNICSWNIIATI